MFQLIVYHAYVLVSVISYGWKKMELSVFCPAIYQCNMPNLPAADNAIARRLNLWKDAAQRAAGPLTEGEEW